MAVEQALEMKGKN